MSSGFFFLILAALASANSGKDSTIHYRDGIPGRGIDTNHMSYENKHVFLINYAIGGASGWQIDLERYGNRSNMYVDYVRVYTRH